MIIPMTSEKWLTTPNYDEYINSVEWEEKRQLRLRMDGFRCHKCGSAINLQVHHITYERLGNELMGDLITLCRNCHKRLHDPEPLMVKETPDDRLRKSARYAGIDEEAFEIFLLTIAKFKTVLANLRFDRELELSDYSGGPTKIAIETIADLKSLIEGLCVMDPVFKEVLDDFIIKYQLSHS